MNSTFNSFFPGTIIQHKDHYTWLSYLVIMIWCCYCSLFFQFLGLIIVLLQSPVLKHSTRIEWLFYLEVITAAKKNKRKITAAWNLCFGKSIFFVKCSIIFSPICSSRILRCFKNTKDIKILYSQSMFPYVAIFFLKKKKKDSCTRCRCIFLWKKWDVFIAYY